jgi:hypothetical protein
MALAQLWSDIAAERRPTPRAGRLRLPAVASPLVVYERPGQSSVAGSLWLDEASETASTGA